MILFSRFMVFIYCMLISVSFLASCEKKQKEGKLLISEQNFVVMQEREDRFTINASGKVKNVGEMDVKNVVITGYCRSCTELWIVGQWVISPDVEKMPNQKDIINYLPVGQEESFSFEEVADLLLQAGQAAAPELPEKLEIVIESFETVE